MTVLYTNHIVGVLSAGVTSGETTLSATAFAGLPAVSGGDVVWLAFADEESMTVLLEQLPQARSPIEDQRRGDACVATPVYVWLHPGSRSPRPAAG